MKTFKQFNEGLKTILGLGLAGYGAYNYFKNRGKKPPTNETPSTKVNKNNSSGDFSTGVDALKQKREDKKNKKIRVFGDPKGEFSDFFDN